MRYVLAVLAATTGSILAVALALRLWRTDLALPLFYSGDSLLVGNWVKTVIDHGWFGSNPSLGFPYGQVHHDYVQGQQWLSYAVLRIVGGLTGDWQLTVNLFYLLTFPAVAMAALFVIHRLGARLSVAVVAAILYALLPFHLVRLTSHLFLMAYMVIPLAGLLLIETFEPTEGTPGARSRWRAGLPSRLALVTAALLGATDAYFAAITLVLLIPAALLAAVMARRVAPLVRASLISGVTLAVLAAGSMNSLLFWLEEGRNPDVASRSARQTEVFALKPLELVLPTDGHRIPLLADVGDFYSGFLVPSEAGSYIGVFGSLGLAVLAAVVAVRLLGRPSGLLAERRSAVMAFFTMLGIAVASVGGFATLIALLVTPQFRAWERMVLVIAFFAMAMTALVLDRLMRRRKLGPIGDALVLALVLGGGLADQTWNGQIPAYGLDLAAFREDAVFVRSIEERFGPTAAVLQLPMIPYPEMGTVAGMADYQHFRGYLHSDSLRWSYGAMKGRDPGWLLAAANRSPDETLVLAALGLLDVLWLDRLGYSDRGATVDEAIRRLGLVDPVVDAGGRREAYSLAPIHDRLARLPAEQLAAAREVIRAPVVVRSARGLEAIRIRDHGPSRTGIADAAISLTNTSATPRIVDVRLTLWGQDAAGRTTIHWPDGAVEPVDLTVTGEIVTHRLEVPAASTVEVGFQTAGPSRVRSDIGPIVVIVGPIDVLEVSLQEALDAVLGPAAGAGEAGS